MNVDRSFILRFRASDRDKLRPDAAAPQLDGSADLARWRTRRVLTEMSRHVPFTMLGAASGLVVLGIWMIAPLPPTAAAWTFETLHPLHVLLSAMATTGLYRRYGGHGWWRLLLIGYVGSVGIATLSDSLIPFAGEALLQLPHRGLHIGFIDAWWLVNPLAVAGVMIGAAWPRTRMPHAGHVLLSTWASLSHILMALGDGATASLWLPIVVFLFLAVWIPCCTSDIVFPLIFASPWPHRVRKRRAAADADPTKEPRP